jgi:predicted component of type VI protein secretion system
MSPSSMAAPRLGSSTMDLVGRIQASQPQEITVTVKSEPGTNAEITQKPKASNVKAGVRKVGTGAL